MDRLAEPGERAILPWRFVAGAFLHLAIPAYAIATLFACLAQAPPHPTAARLLAIAVPFSGAFLALYTGVALLASLGAWVVDPMLRARRRRRAATDPAARAAASGKGCAVAIWQARGVLGAAASDRLDAIEAAGWDHGDERYQAISRDLAKVAAATAALTTAKAGHRARITARVIAALSGIAAALEMLAEQTRKLNEGDLHALSRYVETRYRGADFTGEGDS